MKPFIFQALVVNESMAGMEDAMADPDTEEALAEFDFLVTEGGEGAGEARSHGDGEWGKYIPLLNIKMCDETKGSLVVLT